MRGWGEVMEGGSDLSAQDLGRLNLSAKNLEGVEFECTGFGKI